MSSLNLNKHLIQRCLVRPMWSSLFLMFTCLLAGGIYKTDILVLLFKVILRLKKPPTSVPYSLIYPFIVNVNQFGRLVNNQLTSNGMF